MTDNTSVSDVAVTIATNSLYQLWKKYKYNEDFDPYSLTEGVISSAAISHYKMGYWAQMSTSFGTSFLMSGLKDESQDNALDHWLGAINGTNTSYWLDKLPIRSNVAR